MPDASQAQPLRIQPMRLYICTTCRDAAHSAESPSAGTRLHAALVNASVDPAIELVGVECLSACKRPCTASFTAPGKWTYVFGDLPAEGTAEMLLHGARLYAESADGIIPWRLRPDALKKGAVARVPALPWLSSSAIAAE